MKKHLISLFILGICSLTAYAQQDEFGWRIGGGMGYISYWGDLSNTDQLGSVFKNHYRFEDRRTFQLSAERRLRPGFYAMLSYQQGTITGNDRVDTSYLYYDRALNFETKLRDIHFSLVLGADNDRLLSSNFFIAPYLSLGAGLTHFNIAADLKDANGNFYNYQETAIVQDGVFETNITNIGSDIYGQYVELIPNFSAGFGLRFRFLRRFFLHLQTNFHYTLTDHLDDVGELEFRNEYDSPLQEFAGKPNPNYEGPRAKPNNRKDMYLSTIASLRIGLGRKREGFKAPIFYTTDRYNKTDYTNSSSTNTTKEEPKRTNGSNVNTGDILVENKKLKQELAEMNTRLNELENKPTPTPPTTTPPVYWQLPPNYYPPLPTYTNSIQDTLLQQLNALNQRLDKLEQQNPSTPPQSPNPSINQSLNPSVHQSPNPSVHQSLNPSIPQSPTSILFTQNSLVVQTTELEKLKEIGAILKDNPQQKIQLKGYKAAIGNDYYNRKLSHKRVEVVRDRLINAFLVSQDQIQMVPLAKHPTNSEDLNSKANRRVDIIWID